jgi:hypothetical protein
MYFISRVGHLSAAYNEWSFDQRYAELQPLDQPFEEEEKEKGIALWILNVVQTLISQSSCMRATFCCCSGVTVCYAATSQRRPKVCQLQQQQVISRIEEATKVINLALRSTTSHH